MGLMRATAGDWGSASCPLLSVTPRRPPTPLRSFLLKRVAELVPGPVLLRKCGHFLRAGRPLRCSGRPPAVAESPGALQCPPGRAGAQPLP